MPLKRIFCLSLLTLMLAANGYAQGIPGYNVSNYAGISGFFLQPASIADSRYKFDATVIGAGFTFGNNYVGVIRKWWIPAKDTLPVDWKKQNYIKTYDNYKRKNVNLGMYVTLPSFMLSINKNISVAFTNRVRTYFNIDHLNRDLAKILYNGFDVPELFNLQLRNDQFNINTMTWNEYGLGYAQVVKHDGMHFLKVGGQVKILTGIMASYVYARDFSYSWKNKDTLNVFSSEFGYGASDNLGLTAEELKSKYLDHPGNMLGLNHPNFGFDIGAVYEYRPDYESYKYEMDGNKDLERRDQNKYKLRVGVSLTDIGRIKFKKSQYSGDFKADIRDWNIHEVKIQGKDPIKGVNHLLDSMWGIQTADNFTMALPTAFSLQLDYNIWKTFYFNFTSFTSPRFIKTESKVHALNYYCFGPRWDSKWFGVMMPVTINGYGQTHLGTTLRIGPLIVGTTNIGAFLFQKYVTGYDVHFALKVPIFQPRPKDRDNDHVSNKKDECPDQPGTWATKGCPDKDGDGIIDKKDDCPKNPGPAATNGCPDRDHDGVADKNDLCPDDSGSVATKGCPDKDGDGITDDKDSCPDIAGKPENFGCPDTDGDGVVDPKDKCPNEVGPADNDGCPYGDRDHDSVPDKDDKCPDMAGDRLHAGCPDSDGDGVYDNMDSCINVAGSPANNGCPEKAKDTDGDGVMDDVDKCPDVKGSSAHAGCPDTDGDGVYDDIDECPKTKGLAANNGCPEVKKADKEVAKKAFNNLEFEAKSAVIKPSSYPALEELARVMKEHPNYKLRVAGYTDSIGSAEANMKLSRSRAIAVQVFLYDKGIDPGRVDIEAHGEENPVDTNATEEGRKHNRRVEIEIKFE